MKRKNNNFYNNILKKNQNNNKLNKSLILQNRILKSKMTQKIILNKILTNNKNSHEFNKMIKRMLKNKIAILSQIHQIIKL